MRTKHRIADKLFFLLLTIAVFSSCANSKKDIVPSAEYAPFVNAYTGGVISQTSNIRIELTQDQPMVDLNNELKENPFSFSPSLKGKAYWVSNNTIEFVPEPGTLKPGEFYEGTFQLGRFVEVDSRLKEFKFSFRVQEPNFTLYVEPLTTIDVDSHGDLVTLKGEVRFSDATSKEAVEKMFEGTKVAKVNTMNLDGKTRRRGNVFGKTAAKKKAIVQLTEDSADIEIFSGL